MRLDGARCGRTSFTSMGIGSRLVVSATMLVLASTVAVPSATSETVRPMAYLPPVEVIDNNASRGVSNARQVAYSGRSGFGFRAESNGTFRYDPDGGRLFVAPTSAGSPHRVSVSGRAAMMSGAGGVAVYRYAAAPDRFELAQTTACQVDRGSPELLLAVVICSYTSGIPNLQLWNTSTGALSPIRLPTDGRGFSYSTSQVSESGVVRYTRLVAAPGGVSSSGLEEWEDDPAAPAPVLLASFPGMYRSFDSELLDLNLIFGQCTPGPGGGMSCSPSGAYALFVVKSGGGVPLEVKVPRVVGESGVAIPPVEVLVLGDQRTALACYDNGTQRDKTRCWAGDIVTQVGQFYVDDNPPTTHLPGLLRVAADGTTIAMVGGTGPNSGLFGVLQIGSRLVAGGRLCFGVSGSPGDVAVVNLTPVEAAGGGFGQLVSSDVASPPVASNVNFGPGTIDPNVALATIGVDGRVCYVNSGAAVHLVADHLGTIDGSAYTPATPSGAPDRKADTRIG